MSVLTEPPDISGLAADVSGPVLGPGDPGYAEEVAGFNTAVVHRPAVVVGAATAQDVSTALRYADAHGLPVAVQATGHGANMPFESGLLISTRRLDSVSVDPATRTATLGAGARWREVIDAAAEHGLAPLSGSSSDVGAIGYTIGGGLPVMCRTFGFAADRVVGADLVSADGALHRVDADRDPDLFWGLCGGKGNLGVVTGMTVGLVPVDTVYGGGIFYADEHIPAVLHGYLDWTATLPEETSTSVAILRLPPAPTLPEPIRGRTVAHLRVCHVGDQEEGARLVAPMRGIAAPLLDHVQEMPYTAVDSIHSDPDHPVPFCQGGVLLGELVHETVDALLGAAGPQVHAPLIVCEVRHMGGALRRGPAAGNAVSGRAAAYCLNAVGLMTPETGEAAPAAVAAVLDAAEPWSTGGTLLNLHGRPGDEADRARAWDLATYRRLAELTRRLDPAGLLRHEHAIARGAVGPGPS
jgi:FAD/FMN-containing dehydrogenase